jgi:hypothetical protein
MKLEIKIIVILMIALFAATSGGAYLIEKYRNRAIKAEHNLSLTTEQWKDEKGRLVTEIDQSNINISNMKDIFKKDSSKLVNRYEQRVYGLKRDLDALGIKYKNLLSASGGTVTVRDSFIVKFIKKDTTFTATRDDGFLNQNFTLYRDFSMFSDYTYEDDIKVFDIRRPKLKSNGKPHWPNWGWLYGWDRKTLWVSNNPKASYTGVYSIKIER